jgi:hypothetical protein
MELASVLIAGLALAASLYAILDSRSSARKANEAAGRSAAALEAQAHLAKAASERYEMPWRLTPAIGDMWRLTNSNPVETAFDVTVLAVDERQMTLDMPTHVDIGPGASIEFMGLDMFDDVTDTRVRVTWRRRPTGAVEPPWTSTVA